MTWQLSDLKVLLGLLGVLALVAVGLWATVPAIRFRGLELQLRVERLDRLETGARVLVDGYAVGQVRSIEPLAASGGLDFLVVLTVEGAGEGSPLSLRRGTWAEVTVESLFGSPVVVLHPSTDPHADPLPDGAEIPVRAGRGGMDEIVRRAPLLLDRVDSALARLPSVLDRMERTLANAEVASDTVRVVVSDVRAVTRRARRDVAGILADARGSMERVQALTGRAEGGLDTVLVAATGAVDSAAVVIAEAARLVRDLDTTAGEVTPSVREILRELEETAYVLNNMAREISDRPYRLLSGVTPPEGLPPSEVPPDSGGGGEDPGPR